MNKLSYRTWGVTLVMCTCYVCCACCCAGEVSQQVQHVVDSALPLMIKAFDTDDDKEAVTASCAGVWGHSDGGRGTSLPALHGALGHWG